RDTDSTEKLNALGDGVDEFVLFFVVLIEKKMELVESGSRNLPMRLLVEIAQSHGIGQELVELFGHFEPDGFYQLQRLDTGDGAEGLEFTGGLMESGLG